MCLSAMVPPIRYSDLLIQITKPMKATGDGSTYACWSTFICKIQVWLTWLDCQVVVA